MDATRALLDSLMGEDRNGDRVKVKRKFTDPDVCHYYITGMCPYYEFERTKHDFGPCPLIHDDELKDEWKELDDRAKDRLGFEKELFKWLDKLMLELKAKIRRNEERLASEVAPPISLEDKLKLDELAAELQEMLTRSEVLGEQGDVDGSQAAATQAEAIKARRAIFEEEAAVRAGGGANRYGQQEVCPFSGVIINKEESRLRDHKNGKNYRTWCKTHEVYNSLKETFKRREAERAGPSRSSRPRDGGSRERDRERDRDRDRDRDRKRPRRELEEAYKSESRGDSRRRDSRENRSR